MKYQKQIVIIYNLYIERGIFLLMKSMIVYIFIHRKFKDSLDPLSQINGRYAVYLIVTNSQSAILPSRDVSRVKFRNANQLT